MSLTLRHHAETVDLASAHCELGSLVRSFDGPDTLTLRRAIAFDDPATWQAEDSVQLLLDETLLFDGRIKASERLASAEGECIRYTCLGLRAQADALPYRRVLNGALTPRVVYNCPVEDLFAEAGCVALSGTWRTVGEILADILDSMAAPLAGILGDGTPGSGYLQAELAALDLVPPKLVLCGESVDSALRRVLDCVPHVGYWIDPATHQARFTDLRALEAKDVPGLAAEVLRQQLQLSTADCYTACTVTGGHELVDIVETLTPAWDPELEETWTSDLAAKFPDTYGTVWRLFATSEPAQVGGVVEPDLFITGDDILVSILIDRAIAPQRGFVKATVVDDTKLLLNSFARQWDAGEGEIEKAAGVRARFAYRKGRVSGRYPATGHTGTAHTRRGLIRELAIFDESRDKRTIKGTVGEVLSPTRFRVFFGVACEDELVWTTVEFNGDGIAHVVATNDSATITLEEAPERPLQAGDSFVLTVWDSTRKGCEGGTLSLLEAMAKAALAPVMDERIEGVIPLAGLDWSFGLGQKINFTGTGDPEHASLGAPLAAVEHDLARERTVLRLAPPRAGRPAWADPDRQLHLEADETRLQLERLRRRHRRRRGALRGAIGDPHELEPPPPLLAGDGIWTEVGGYQDYKVKHIGPGSIDRTLGGTGKYIEWVSLDLRGHVVEAGVGTFT